MGLSGRPPRLDPRVRPGGIIDFLPAICSSTTPDRPTKCSEAYKDCKREVGWSSNEAEAVKTGKGGTASEAYSDGSSSCVSSRSIAKAACWHLLICLVFSLFGPLDLWNNRPTRLTPLCCKERWTRMRWKISVSGSNATWNREEYTLD